MFIVHYRMCIMKLHDHQNEINKSLLLRNGVRVFEGLIIYKCNVIIITTIINNKYGSRTLSADHDNDFPRPLNFAFLNNLTIKHSFFLPKIVSLPKKISLIHILLAKFQILQRAHQVQNFQGLVMKVLTSVVFITLFITLFLRKVSLNGLWLTLKMKLPWNIGT